MSAMTMCLRGHDHFITGTARHSRGDLYSVCVPTTIVRDINIRSLL